MPHAAGLCTRTLSVDRDGSGRGGRGLTARTPAVILSAVNDVLLASWARLWPALGARGDGIALRDALLASYAQPQRHYHSQQHLAECIGWFERVQGLTPSAAEVEAALWFHDAVYEPANDDNEARSAAWARRSLQDAGVALPVAARVEALVMTTRHTALPEGADAQLLVDIDLAILGAPRPRFDEYERQIRAEYAFVAEPLFAARRREVLRSFAQRPFIYTTAWFRERLEAAARGNLARAIDGA